MQIEYFMMYEFLPWLAILVSTFIAMYGYT